MDGHAILVALSTAGTGMTSDGMSAAALVIAFVTLKPHSSSHRR
jgi:hypothetical protein